MSTGPRVPPRFVPTLTTVLDLPPPLSAESAPIESSPAESDASAPVVPGETFAPEVTPDASAHVALPPAERLSELEAFRLEEHLLHRVLQRVDLSLEAQLSDAVSAAVQQQLDAMVPRLRNEIETVLRSLVIEALAKELSENPGTTPP